MAAPADQRVVGQGAVEAGVDFPLDIVDYVIAHELAHLREMNHSARFWQHLETLYPDYRRAREWLRAYPDDTLIS